MKKLEHVGEQYILYAKGHYVKSNDSIADLIELNENYSGLPKGSLNIENVYKNLYRTFCEVASYTEMLSFFQYLFGFSFIDEKRSIDKEAVIDRMLGCMSVLPVLDRQGNILLELPKPNPEYLTLSRGATLMFNENKDSKCPVCGSKSIELLDGMDEQFYYCHGCDANFDYIKGE